jgi:hypothetical protein
MTSHWVEKRLPIRAEWLLVFGAALMVACGASGDVGRGPTDVGSPPGKTPDGPTSGCPGYADQTHCPPFPTGGPYSISGVLTLRTATGTAPLANTGVGAFVVMTNGSGYGMAPAITDADGRYRFSNVPNGQVFLFGGAPHAYQPCVAIATVSGANGEKDIELLDSAVTRPLTAADSPILSGIVYRYTNAGRQPVAGAAIEFEYPAAIVAQTITDAQGRYSLCGLPMGRGGLNVWLDGLPVGGSIVNISGDQVLDFELFATGERYSISGVLTLRTASGTAPLASTVVGAFVFTTNGNSYGLASVMTDADGRYQFSYMPNGYVVLFGGAPHTYQPCAAIAFVSGANGVKDFELVDSAATRPETAADSPTLSGIVYRSTNAGRQPVAGASIRFKYASVIAAKTITDAQGRYSLCHLPTGPAGLDVWLNGVAVSSSVVNIGGDQVLNFDLSK